MLGIRGRFLLGRLGLCSGALAVSFREGSSKSQKMMNPMSWGKKTTKTFDLVQKPYRECWTTQIVKCSLRMSFAEPVCWTHLFQEKRDWNLLCWKKDAFLSECSIVGHPRYHGHKKPENCFEDLGILLLYPFNNQRHKPRKKEVIGEYNPRPYHDPTGGD